MALSFIHGDTMVTRFLAFWNLSSLLYKLGQYHRGYPHDSVRQSIPGALSGAWHTVGSQVAVLMVTIIL